MHGQESVNDLHGWTESMCTETGERKGSRKSRVKLSAGKEVSGR